MRGYMYDMTPNNIYHQRKKIKEDTTTARQYKISHARQQKR